VRRVIFREPITAAILSSHRRVPPFGLAGGEPGEVGRNWIERADGTLEPLAGCDQREMRPGERTGVFRVGGSVVVRDAEGNSRISMEDFAVATVDELENPQHIGEQMTVAY